MDASSTKKRIVEYFRKNSNKGYTLESLKWALYNQGYSKGVIEEGLKLYHAELAVNAPVLKEEPKITYEVIGDNDKPIDTRPLWKRILFFWR